MKTRLSLAALVLCAAPALAQAPPDWAAIGQITYAGDSPGDAICTGTLVAPDLVLTAGHCVPDGTLPMTVRFAAGWHKGAATATRQGAGVIASTVPGVAGDLALLRLATPIPPTQVRPLPLTGGAAAERAFTTAAYRRDAPATLQRSDDCALMAAERGLLGFDCPVVSGNSGAPVLIRREGAWHVAAVLVGSAPSPHPIRAFAAIPDPVLLTHVPAP